MLSEFYSVASSTIISSTSGVDSSGYSISTTSTTSSVSRMLSSVISGELLDV